MGRRDAKQSGRALFKKRNQIFGMMSWAASVEIQMHTGNSYTIKSFRECSVENLKEAGDGVAQS